MTYMRFMFLDAKSFNKPLNKWNVSNVTNMLGMFSSASSFNQPLNNWDVSKVTNMWRMFENASSFNQPLDNWNVSNVTWCMNSMFSQYLTVRGRQQATVVLVQVLDDHTGAALL